MYAALTIVQLSGSHLLHDITTPTRTRKEVQGQAEFIDVEVAEKASGGVIDEVIESDGLIVRERDTAIEKRV